MVDGITIKILGDFGPFSKVGKSIGYLVTIGDASYLIDCGAPPFRQIEGLELQNINGIIITHCHDDHKRWFTDIALFYRYESNKSKKITLLTTEDIRDELIKASGPALDRSLSKDSKDVIDIAFEDYMKFLTLGPKARYRMISRDEGSGKTALYITDLNGNIIGPDKAKIIISQKSKRPRMLFKDPEYKEWIEPESFYPFSSNLFYEGDKNIYGDKEGFAIEAIKAPVWHGISTVGIKIRTDKETLVLSSDTTDDINLWKQLYTEKRKQRLGGMSKEEFESASIIYGNINDYIERVWSEERYAEAIKAFEDAVVIHDIASSESVVHTDYERLENTFLNKYKVMLTHSPDQITSEWVLCGIDKTYKIIGDEFFEVVDNKLYPINADVYHRNGEEYYVGYRNDNGRYILYEKEGLLNLSEDEGSNNGNPLYRVDLYEDISGKYFPFIGDKDKKRMYLEREDGKVELIEFTDDGSRGTVIESVRDKILELNMTATKGNKMAITE
jgi:ribonuclease BN (tRNA processing enzyme)